MKKAIISSKEEFYISSYIYISKNWELRSRLEVEKKIKMIQRISFKGRLLFLSLKNKIRDWLRRAQLWLKNKPFIVVKIYPPFLFFDFFRQGKGQSLPNQREARLTEAAEASCGWRSGQFPPKQRCFITLTKIGIFLFLILLCFPITFTDLKKKKKKPRDFFHPKVLFILNPSNFMSQWCSNLRKTQNPEV